MRIYLDNAATTPIHPQVIEHIAETMSSVYGNPSSIHQAGRKSRALIEEARKKVAQHLNASIGEIFFTSSATEANNMILRKCVEDLEVTRIITSAIEHPCVMETAKALSESHGIEHRIIGVNSVGEINLDELDNALSEDNQKSLVSIMHVNNEIGVINDILAISAIVRKHEALFHTDAVQGVGKLEYDLSKKTIDFLSASAHKFHGPKGVGFIYINNDIKLKPFMTGGGQERTMRSGTENVYGISGLALALDLYIQDRDSNVLKIQGLKDRFKNGLKEAIPDIRYLEDEGNGNFVSNILSCSFPANEKTELMTFNLDIAGIEASAGSACSSGVERASHVLSAIGSSENSKVIRFSFSYLNTEEEIIEAIQRISKIFS